MISLAKILLAIALMFRTENAIAISSNELMTNDGNIWAVYDELEVDREYTVIFSNNNTESIYDDIIISVK